MALRILLADESATIKKVIELSLQDYSVDLKTVNLGVDVLEVTKSFQPDLIFVDILLQKKNGYEVCHELKQDAETKNIPVVILWSGFMELDQQKMQVCGADSSLEKPFDSENLRALINKYVPRIKEANPLLQHIKLPKIETPQDFTQVMPSHSKESSDKEEASNEAWNMDSFDDLPELDLDETQHEDEIGLELADEDLDDFSQFEIKGHSLSAENSKVGTLIESDEDEEAGWVSQKLGKFQLNVPDAEEDYDELTNIEVPEIEDPISDTSFLWTSDKVEEPTSSSEEIHNNSQALETPETQADRESSFVDDEGTNVWNQTKHIDELDLSLSTEPENFEIERNEDIGIEVLEDPIPRSEASNSSHNPPNIGIKLEDFLQSEQFKQILEIKLEERLQEIVESLVPKIAQKAVEKEIQRLLNDPY